MWKVAWTLINLMLIASWIIYFMLHPAQSAEAVSQPFTILLMLYIASDSLKTIVSAMMKQVNE